jgi:hypothetical protein
MLDLTDTLCDCKKGYYRESLLNDDHDGTLHCTNCYKEVKRYKEDLPLPESDFVAYTIPNCKEVPKHSFSVNSCGSGSIPRFTELGVPAPSAYNYTELESEVIENKLSLTIKQEDGKMMRMTADLSNVHWETLPVRSEYHGIIIETELPPGIEPVIPLGKADREAARKYLNNELMDAYSQDLLRNLC